MQDMFARLKSTSGLLTTGSSRMPDKSWEGFGGRSNWKYGRLGCELEKQFLIRREDLVLSK